MSERILDYITAGGFVMPPLIVATLVLWYAVGLRWLTLRSPRVPLARRFECCGGGSDILTRACQQVRGLDRQHPHLSQAIDDVLQGFDGELRRGDSVIQAIVVAAPLTGLLGTVVGMIETFDGLSSMALFSQSGGVAGGISQALITTQMGLAVAIPGVFAARLLRRRERQLGESLAQLKHLALGAAQS